MNSTGMADSAEPLFRHGKGRIWAAASSCLFLTLGCARPQQEVDTRSVRYYQPPVRAYRSTTSAASTTATPGTSCDTGRGIFSGGSWINRSVVNAARSPDSDAIVRFLETSHRGPGKFQVDFSLVLLEAERSTQRQTFKRSPGHELPDCDITPVPLPAKGRLQGERGYACEGDGDCHLLVLERQECRLYEMSRANVRGNSFQGGCLAVWNLAEPYPAKGRGEGCSSAGGAGLPIAPLLFNPDDLARGEITHALRFALPSTLIRRLAYVAPGTHSTKSTEGPDNAPPYGALFRLRPEIDLGSYKPAARVVLDALQNYGMYLADEDNVTFSAASDAMSVLKWSDVAFGPNDLAELRWTDFEVVDAGEPRVWQGQCARKPLTE